MVVKTIVTVTDIRLQAARVLESDGLRRAVRLRDLLAFFVEERIAFGDRPIGQRRLAEVLGMHAEFSPTANAHVRIYLRRLRHSLATYYGGPGAADPLLLGITTGPYRLSTEWRTSADGAGHPDGHHPASDTRTAARSVAMSAPLVLLTEFAAPGLEGDLRHLAAIVPRALVPYMLGQDGLVAIGPVPRHAISEPVCESPVARSSAADHLLEGTLAAGPQQAEATRYVDTTIRLHHIGTGQHLWSHTCGDDFDLRDLVAASEMIAARLAAALLARTG